MYSSKKKRISRYQRAVAQGIARNAAGKLEEALRKNKEKSLTKPPKHSKSGDYPKVAGFIFPGH